MKHLILSYVKCLDCGKPLSEGEGPVCIECTVDGGVR